MAILLSGTGGFWVTLALLSVPASATHDCSGTTDKRVMFSPATNGRGVRVGLNAPGMYVADTPVPCARASVLAVVNNLETRAVEIGWYEEVVDISPCPPASSPRVLVVKIAQSVR